MAKSKFISASEAAKLANVTTETIRNLCKARTLQYKIRGILYYVSREDVEKYKETIEAIHEATASIIEYRANVEQDAKELRQKHEDYRERMMFLEMFPKRIVATLEVVKAVVYNYQDINEKHNCFDPRYTDVVLSVLNGKPYREIAERMHLQEPSVKAIWHKALRKFQYTLNRIDMLEKIIEDRNKEIAERDDIIRELNGRNAATAEQINVETRLRNLLSTRLEDCDLSVRALQCLRCAELRTIGDLVKYNRTDLLKFRNFGKKSLTELDEFLERQDLHFGMDIDYLYQTK